MNLANQQVNSRVVYIPHAYIDIAGDLATGALLSQILYLFPRNNTPIFKEGEIWLVKKREDWWGEIRISPEQYDRSIKILEDLGFVEVKTFKFNGVPTKHIRPLYDNIIAAIEKWGTEQASKGE